MISKEISVRFNFTFMFGLLHSLYIHIHLLLSNYNPLNQLIHLWYFWVREETSWCARELLRIPIIRYMEDFPWLEKLLLHTLASLLHYFPHCCVFRRKMTSPSRHLGIKVSGEGLSLWFILFGWEEPGLSCSTCVRSAPTTMCSAELCWLTPAQGLEAKAASFAWLAFQD